MARGGRRAGAGRKKSNDPTTVIRIPESKKYFIKQWLKNDRKSYESYENTEVQSSIGKAKQILEDSLKLKANAGGKIKTEIRRALKILQG